MSDHTIVVIWVVNIFLYSSFVYSCHIFLISFASVRSILFLYVTVPIFREIVPSVQSLICVRHSATPWPHHTRPPCTSPTPRVHPNSCPLSQWCHPTILSFVVPFFFCLQSFPASGLFFFFFPFHQVAKVLELQHQSSQWIFRTDFLLDWLVWSPCSPRDF